LQKTKGNQALKLLLRIRTIWILEYYYHINSDEHDTKHGVRSEQEQPLAPEHRDKPRPSSYQ